MRAAGKLSTQEARWLALAAQGLGRPRPAGAVTRRHLGAALAAVGTLQLDAINVVERTQFLVLFSRLGTYDKAWLHELTGPGGDLFEYWGHAASLLHMHDHTLFRWRMELPGFYGDSPLYAERREAWRKEHAVYIAAIFDEVRGKGPLAASQLADPRRRDGDWWDRRGDGRQALEFLFARGELAAWRTPNFERVYDLPERVIPAEVLAEPTPPIEEAHRRLLVRSAASLGVGTVRDLADYYRLKPAVAKLRVAELVEDGALVPVKVDGWREAAFMLPATKVVRPRRDQATLLSPFDSLIWDRARTERLFGFEYRIEVYVPEPKRTYGYYVLPLLLGDDLVARLDLKADRKTSTLRVAAAHLEAGHDLATVADAAAVELGALQRWLGLDRIEVWDRGDLAAALDRAVRSSG